MTEQPTLGQLCTSDARRDAIHVAIAPVQAAEELYPGEDVGFTVDRRVGRCNHVHTDEEFTLIGIVDPFLMENVHENEWFYLWLYPNTVTSLRHAWTHPAFKPQLPRKEQL